MKSNWLRSAMTDDNLVADFLLHLNHPDLRPPSRAKPPSPPLPPLDWGIRQPRSKSAASFPKVHDSSRRSPTTPLSWTASGATASPSDSCDESSLPLVSAARFKDSAIADITNSVNSSKMPKRKRTYAELKEEESSLLKEREHLSKQMESLHMKLAEKRSCNENLKRIKYTINSQPKREASKKVKSGEISEHHNEQEPRFVLPDLNMMPIEDCKF